LKTQEIRLHQKPIQLTPREFSVMAILAKHAPVIVSYQIICNEIWGEDSSEARKRTKYLVYLLRKKLDQAVPDLDLIINLDRLGYKLQTDR
jgi:DNA-binding response OmpR family regulator